MSTLTYLLAVLAATHTVVLAALILCAWASAERAINHWARKEGQ